MTVPLILLIFSCVTVQPHVYKAIRVIDGDSIVISLGDEKQLIRLVGIDAPETSKNKRDPGQPYSQQSKKYLTDFTTCCYMTNMNSKPRFIISDLHLGDGHSVWEDFDVGCTENFVNFFWNFVDFWLHFTFLRYIFDA